MVHHDDKTACKAPAKSTNTIRSTDNPKLAKPQISKGQSPCLGVTLQQKHNAVAACETNTGCARIVLKTIPKLLKQHAAIVLRTIQNLLEHIDATVFKTIPKTIETNFNIIPKLLQQTPDA